MSSQPTFTILLPVHRPPAMLPYAVRSVQAQTRPDFELFIVCDGAPDATAQVARQMVAADRRLRVFAFEKGERHGEAHRHAALSEARGKFVAHIGDDDFWFPEHLEELARLLADHEFGNTLQLELLADGNTHLYFADLADPSVQRRMLSEPFNFFGPSVAAYRLSTYRRLDDGWAPAPTDVWTDLHMWRKFLRLDPIAAGTRFSIAGLKLAAVHRQEMSIDERGREMAVVAERVACPAERDRLVQQGMASLSSRLASQQQRILEQRHRIERLRARVERIAGGGSDSPKVPTAAPGPVHDEPALKEDRPGIWHRLRRRLSGSTRAR